MKFEQHEIDFVLKFFKNYMTQVESAAATAVVFKSDFGEGEQTHITFVGDFSESVEAEARTIISKGYSQFSKSIAKRIYSDNKVEIDALRCPKCQRLPATPTASICIWCKHSL